MASDHLDKLACAGCGRILLSMDGPGMLRAMKGPCPDCGGRFAIVGHITIDREPADRVMEEPPPA